MAEYNSMLYQAKRLNAAYERFLVLKHIIGLESSDIAGRRTPLASEQDQVIKHEDKKSAESEPADIKKTSDVSSKPQTGNSNPNQEKK